MEKKEEVKKEEVKKTVRPVVKTPTKAGEEAYLQSDHTIILKEK